MDELKGAAKRGLDKLVLARDRERMRVEDRLAKLDEIDECAREYSRLKRHSGIPTPKELEKNRLRMLGLAPIIGDDKVRDLVRAFIEGPPDDDKYVALAERLAQLRERTFGPE